jgi:threonine dehydratase
MIGLKDVLAAARRIRPFLAPTLVEPAPDFGQTWLKLENTNPTHSFKARGALNAVLGLPPHLRSRVVTASSGNHAQGMAWATGVVPTLMEIVMPADAPLRKIDGVRRFGLTPRLMPDGYDAAEDEARRLAREEGYTYVSPYNHPLVAAGNGTVGLEIIEQLPATRRVIVPVGGGGLIGGMAAAIKALDPSVEVIGVNAAVSPDMYNAYYGASLPIGHDTLADALPGAVETGSITLDLARAYVDRIVLVDEDAIAAAMRWLLDHTGWIVEGGGAVGIAALLSGVVEMGDIQTAVVISGGNVDPAVVRRVMLA